ncbi:MAG: V-type ATPase subunit [Coriobacteriia bacterium]
MTHAVTRHRQRRPISSSYGYGNARVRGMRSRMITSDTFEQVMKCWDLGDAVELLAPTDYGPDIDEALLEGGVKPSSIDEAFKENMVRTYRKVLDFVSAEARTILGTLLGKWDLLNIKTVLRGVHMGLAPEEIEESLIAAGAMSAIELRELAHRRDVRDVVDTLVIWDVDYAHALNESIVEYVRTSDLAVLELALDRFYSKWATKRLAGKGHNYATARRILAVQIDAVDLVTVFRVQKADMRSEEAKRFFLPGGLHVTERLFADLVQMSDIDEVLARLARTPYERVLVEAVKTYAEHGTISTLERALEDHLMRKALAVGTGDALGVGVLISYLWAKQNEVTNLRIVIRGIASGMTEKRMKEELILV